MARATPLTTAEGEIQPDNPLQSRPIPSWTLALGTQNPASFIYERSFDRDACPECSFRWHDERFGPCHQDLGENRRLLVVCQGSACELGENLTTILARSHPNEAEDEHPDSWRNFEQFHDWRTVKDGLRGNRFGRRERDIFLFTRGHVSKNLVVGPALPLGPSPSLCQALAS